MDNLTHTIIGLAAGELIARSLPAEPDHGRQSARQRLLLVTAALASNFPDIDLAVMPFLARPLGYLLEHRGHTHTLLFALPQALLLVALLWLLWPGARRILRASKPARTGVALAVAIGLLLHLGMDFLNSYGLHPFAPLDARWFYGDTIYIIEPMFWVLLGVPLIMQIRRTSLRTSSLALMALGLTACMAAGFLLWQSLLLLALAGVALGALQRRWRHALAAGVLLSLGWIALQAGTGHLARAEMAASLAQQYPGSALLDAAMTPFPANPLCWSFVSVDTDAAQGSYQLRRGVLSLSEAVVPTASCPLKLAGGVVAPGQRGIAWLGSNAASLSALRQLQQSNCHFAAWLRFARMPSLDGGSATDLRFGNLGAANFSTIDYAARAGTPCPAWLPAWIPPRADLLRVLSSTPPLTAPP